MQSDPPPRDDRDDAEGHRVAERLLPELIKRLFEAGVGKLAEGPENLRHFVGELRLPKEIGNYILAQIDETKNGLYRVVAKELRDFLEHTNLAEELGHVLSRMSLEIKTEIRFVPNGIPGHVMPKPEIVKTEVDILDGNPEAAKDERSKRRSTR